jgi:preprotein translocase subunit Sec61beta
MPQSTAGLIRYYDQESSRSALKFRPEQILAGIAVIIVLELALMILF